MGMHINLHAYMTQPASGLPNQEKGSGHSSHSGIQKLLGCGVRVSGSRSCWVWSYGIRVLDLGHFRAGV